MNTTCLLSNFVDVIGSNMLLHFSLLAKAALTISHGYAPVQCSFSVNMTVLSKEKCLQMTRPHKSKGVFIVTQLNSTQLDSVNNS